MSYYETDTQQYQWNSNVNATLLQIYFRTPVTVIGEPASSFINLESLLTGTYFLSSHLLALILQTRRT